MIAVFKTNVRLQKDARHVIATLKKQIDHAKINFDLEDCDNILRIAGTKRSAYRTVRNCLHELGYQCEILD